METFMPYDDSKVREHFIGCDRVLKCTADFRLAHESSLSSIEPWRQLVHPNVVRVQEAFTTRAFSDSCA